MIRSALILALSAILASPAHASPACASVGSDYVSVPCAGDTDGQMPAWACAQLTPEAAKAHEDCEQQVATRDAALVALAARVGAIDYRHQSTYGWRFLISTSDGEHQYDLLELLTMTLDKAERSRAVIK